MRRAEEFSSDQRRRRPSETSQSRYWLPEKPHRFGRSAPLSIGPSPLRSLSRLIPTNGCATPNASNNTARQFMPEIKETTHLKDLWNEEHAQQLGGNQL